jgi:hypothetical protein
MTVATSKLRMPKAGPFIVVGINGDKYSIRNLSTHKVTDTYLSMPLTYTSSGMILPQE